MLPVLRQNTLILGLRRIRSLQPDDVIIFLHEGREKIKRVSKVRGSQVFVLCDNNRASTDSRHFGWIDKNTVLAKVVFPRKRRS